MRTLQLPAMFLTVLFVASPERVAAVEQTFVRGDANADGAITIGDSEVTLQALFLGGGLSCLDAADVNDDGQLDVSDPIYVLLHLFAGRPSPGEPTGACGVDPTDDLLDCASFPPCGGGIPSPDPLDTTVTIDRERTVTALVRKEGGTVSVTAEDGVVLTLELPPGALLGDQELSVTPIRSIEGFPFSGPLLEGLHLEPEGLALFKPAKLTIELPSPPDPASLVAFAYEEGGIEFHLVPFSVEGNTVAIDVSHFSGYGAGAGGPGGMGSHVPSNAQSWGQQALANLLRSIEERGGNFTEEDFEAAAAILRQWYDGWVRGLLKRAETDDSIIEQTAYEFVVWWEQCIWFGVEDRLSVEIDAGLASLDKGFVNAINKSYERCTSSSDASESILIIIRWELATLLGLPSVTAEFAADKVRRCARFELDFETTLTLSDDDGEVFTGQLRATGLPVIMDESLLYFQGQGGLEYPKFEPERECAVTLATIGSTAVASLVIQWNWTRPGRDTPVQIHPTFRLYFFPGTPMERVMVGCDDPAQVTSSDTAGAWTVAHLDEGGMPPEGVSGWTYLGGQLFAERTYQRTVGFPGGDGTIEEDTKFELWHAPE